MRKIAKNIISIGILFIFLIPMVYSTNTKIERTNNEIGLDEPNASTMPNQFYWCPPAILYNSYNLRFTNTRYSIVWDFNALFVNMAININAGTYHGSLMAMNLNNTINAITGQYQIYTAFDPYCSGFGDSLTDSLGMALHGESKTYLINTTFNTLIGQSVYREQYAMPALMLISDDTESVQMPNSWYRGIGTNDIALVTYYDFILNLIIDSHYYDLSNIKIRVVDKNNTQWRYCNPDSINIRNPEYKIEIYDKESDGLIFTDSSFQIFTLDRTITLPSFKVTNNYKEPINITYTTNSVNKSIIVQPYQSQPCLNESSTIVRYTITDLGNNILEINQAILDQITYTPPSYEECQITYVDQFGEFIDFENYLTYLNNIQIPRTFYAEKDSTIQIVTKTLNNEQINTTNHLITQGSNFINIEVHSIRIKNNWDKSIITYISNGTNPFDYYYSGGKIDNSNYYNFSVQINPFEEKIQNSTFSIYYYAITDIYNNILQIGNIDSTTNKIIYNSPETTQTLISFLDQDGNLLDFNNYNVYLNNTRIYEPINNLLINSSYTIEVFDILNNSVYSISHLINRTNNELVIILNVFELKIMNLMITNTTILIENNLATYDILDISNPNELLSYKLQPAKYNITYTNELGSVIKTEIDLTSNDYTFLLQTLQKDFTISLFDESGFGVSLDNVRLYYDNVRTSGFLRTFDGIHNIRVLDYFNTSLFDQNVDITPYTEFNVYLPIYTLIICNNYSQQMNMIIEREGITFAVVDQIIPALSSYQFRFAANLDYIISMIYLNGTYADNKTINLASNVQIESFGYYSLADITQIDNKFSGSEIGLIIAVIVGLAFISIQSLRKPKVYKTESPIPLPRRRDNNPKNRRLR